MRILVSFYAKQSSLARRIIEECRSREIDAENNDLRLRCHGKENFEEFLLREVRKYDAVFVLWSEEYSSDEWLQDELFAIATVNQERQSEFVYVASIDSTKVHATIKRCLQVDMRGREAEGVNELVTTIPQNKNIFVMMKFSDKDLDSTYNLAIRPVAERFGYDVLRIDERESSDSVTYGILKGIEGAGTVVGDLTGERPNVYFEIGYAIALGKEVILSCKKGSNIHFDLADRGILFWETPDELKKKLINRFDHLAGPRS